MKIFATIFFLLPALLAPAQNFGYRLTAAGVYLPDNNYTQTTIDINGVKAVAMGTANNLVAASDDLRDFLGDNYAALFKGNDAPEVATTGNKTYYKYNDKIIIEERRDVRETALQVGAEAGFYSGVFTASAGLRNSKYRYLAPDFYAMASLRPWSAYLAIMAIASPFTREQTFYDKALSAFVFGYTAGSDMGTPGFLNFGDKSYRGFIFGVSPKIGRVGIEMQGFVARGTKPGHINQSTISAGIKYDLH